MLNLSTHLACHASLTVKHSIQDRNSDRRGKRVRKRSSNRLEIWPGSFEMMNLYSRMSSWLTKDWTSRAIIVTFLLHDGSNGFANGWAGEREREGEVRIGSWLGRMEKERSRWELTFEVTWLGHDWLLGMRFELVEVFEMKWLFVGGEKSQDCERMTKSKVPEREWKIAGLIREVWLAALIPLWMSLFDKIRTSNHIQSNRNENCRQRVRGWGERGRVNSA